MRQFRGLTKDGNLVYGWYYYNHFVDEHKIFVCKDHSTYDIFDVIGETVGQSTGLKDKNKKDVYAGDIYKWYQPLVENGKQIRKEHLSVVIDEIVELYHLHNRAENCWGGIEIIGNKTENPELLEQK